MRQIIRLSVFLFLTGVILLTTPRIHAGSPLIREIKWSPDGSMLATVGFGITLYSEDLEIITATYPNNNYLPVSYSVQWNPKGDHFLITYDHNCRIVPACVRWGIWNAEQFEEIATYFLPSQKWISFGSPFWDTEDQRIYLVAQEENKQPAIYTWDGAFPTFAKEIPLLENEYLYSFQSSPDQTQFVFTVQISSENSDKTVLRSMNTNLQSIIWEIEPTEETIYNISWPDSEKLAIEMFDKVEIHSAISGELLQVLPIGRRQETAWSPDGNYIAGLYEKELEIWSMKTGESVKVFSEEFDQSPLSHITTIDWHPTDMKIAAAYWNGEVKLFDVSDLTTSANDQP
jgi:WD40 repeat protein